jgi:integrase/recombinase XerD
MSQQTLQTRIPPSTQLLEMFRADCFDRGLGEETVRHYSSYVREFLQYLNGRGMSAINVDKHVLADYIRLRRDRIDQKTLQKEFAGISGLFEYLVFQDYLGRNPVPGVRKRYLRQYKNETEGNVESPRKLLTVQEMSSLINSIIDTRDKAIMALLAKTGVRRGELIAMDVTDINWIEQFITLKPKKFKKRSGRTVFFDDETAGVLKRWLAQRQNMNPQTLALFVGEKGGRLKRNGVYSMVVKYAEQIGLHNPNSQNPEDHFGPHCCRVWFTTHLRRAGMDREFIKVLRGDRRREAIDLYDRIDSEELRRAYLAFIPRLGI